MSENRQKAIKSYYETRYVPSDMGPSRRSPKSFQPFLDWVGANPGDRLIDVACGTGPLLKCAPPEIKTWGIDLSNRAIQIARDQVGLSTLSIGDMQTLPYKSGSFNIVMNIGALEHVPNMGKALMEMARICEANGKLCLVVPNANFFWWRVLGQAGTEQSLMEEHLLTLSEWFELIQRARLRVVGLQRDPGPNIRTDFGLKVFFRGVFRKIALSLTAFLPITSTYQFVFICQKA